MFSTGTPASTVTMFRFAMYAATVPPPPWSTLPRVAICHRTPLSSKVLRTWSMASAEASEAPPLPRDPVYLQMLMP